MPIFQETRNSVRQAVGRSTGHLVGRRTYAVTSGTPQLVRAEDLLLRTVEQGQGLQLYVASGGGAGQARTVVSVAAFVQGTGSILYPHVNFTTAPSTNAALELWSGIEAPAVNGFIDDAIRNAARRILDHKEDVTTTLTKGTYSYNLPTGFAFISEVWLESRSTDDTYAGRIPSDYWSIDAGASTPVIHFNKEYIKGELVDGRKVKFVGQSHPTLPTADTDNLTVDPEYVRLHAMYSILDSMPWDEIDRSKRDRWKQDAANKLADITTAVYPDAVPIEAW